MPDVHAILSASGAARWMNCPPSVMLEKKFPDKGSVYAEEGTLAHTLAEVRLRTEYEGKTAQWARTQLRGIRKSEYYTEEMEEHIDRYASLVAEAINEAGKICPDPKIMFEQRLDFSEYVPEGFGTGDVVIIADDMVQVIDLKYGKGVPVSAE